MHAYYTDNERSQRMAEAFAAGAGCRAVHVREGLQPGPVAVYGMLRGLREILAAARDEGRDWYYLDHAYFGRGEYWRVTRNAMQYAGEGAQPHGLARLYRHDLPWGEWRKDGRHILLAQQSSAWYELNDLGGREAWTQRTLEAIRQHTQRPVVVRAKDSATPLEDDLADCWAVVTHASNVAVDAIVRGVPAFALGQSAAAPLALSDLSKIERPRRYEDRLHWAATLAANQWTLDEIREGTCWNDLSA